MAAPSAVVTQEPRHHDVIMERNDQFENEIWDAMSGRPGAHPDAVASSIEEPGPAEPSSEAEIPSLPHPTPPQPTTQTPTFLPPGHGRTPQQTAAAERLSAAVTAQTRQREEAARALQARLAAQTGVTATPSDDIAGRQLLRQERDRVRREQREQVQRPFPTQPPVSADAQTFQPPAEPAIIPATAPTSVLTTRLTYSQQWQYVPFQPSHDLLNRQPLSIQGSAPPVRADNNSMALQHEGDSIFSQMMNDLIAARKVAGEVVYRQVQLPADRPIPFGREFLFFGEFVEPDHWLLLRAVGPGSIIRAVRNARNGDMVGWHDSLSRRPGRVHLFPTESPGRRAAEED